MPRTCRRVRPDFRTWAPTRIAVLALVAIVARPVVTAGDTVVLKNGIVYRGEIDRDKPILWVYDGLRRIVLRDSKVARIDSDASYRNLETFKIEQPLVVHGGSMPKEVLSVKAAPWNDRGRRSFTFEGPRLGKFGRMEQAINEMGPHLVKIRGVDGYWQSQLATRQIPREIVLAILAKVDRKDRNERVRVARFLIQAEWYDEARDELERIGRDFPDDADLRERIAVAQATVAQLRAAAIRSEIDRCRAAQQPKRAASLLKSFPTKDVSSDLAAQVAELSRTIETQAAADRQEADDLRVLSGKAASADRAQWTPRVNEVLRAMKEAPDAVRDRLAAWRKARTEGGKSNDALFALAMSGYVVGADAAVEEVKQALTLWTMRDEVRDYLRSTDPAERDEHLSRLDGTDLPPLDLAKPDPMRRLDVVTRLAVRMPPPLHEDEPAADPAGSAAPASAAGPKTHRVRDDENAEPTEYAVSLPPEYHPLRSYPAVVALHDGGGPPSALAWWSAEASRRGYIVIAPEYRVAGQGKDYQYTPSEHAAVELALRDARRRYAIDGDRVFVGGVLAGANMAWDFGLGHPDLFAGVVVVSGMPFKYVNRYLKHAEKLPLYVTLGDLAPASSEVIFGQILKPLILRAWDVTYVEYLKRGLEDFPEEAVSAFDWMDRKRRDPYPKAFEAATARVCDNRFFGVVVRELHPGRSTAPEVVEGFGRNLNPATIKVTTSALSNLVKVQLGGVRRLDVWVSPRVLDLRRKLEVRVNGRTYYKDTPKPELGPLLEDLRIRGDRQQVYWLKVPVG
jgi:dienelactone hydrolase